MEKTRKDEYIKCSHCNYLRHKSEYFNDALNIKYINKKKRICKYCCNRINKERNNLLCKYGKQPEY